MSKESTESEDGAGEADADADAAGKVKGKGVASGSGQTGRLGPPPLIRGAFAGLAVGLVLALIRWLTAEAVHEARIEIEVVSLPAPEAVVAGSQPVQLPFAEELEMRVHRWRSEDWWHSFVNDLRKQDPTADERLEAWGGDKATTRLREAFVIQSDRHSRYLRLQLRHPNLDIARRELEQVAAAMIEEEREQRLGHVRRSLARLEEEFDRLEEAYVSMDRLRLLYESLLSEALPEDPVRLVSTIRQAVAAFPKESAFWQERAEVDTGPPGIVDLESLLVWRWDRAEEALTVNNERTLELRQDKDELEAAIAAATPGFHVLGRGHSDEPVSPKLRELLLRFSIMGFVVGGAVALLSDLVAPRRLAGDFTPQASDGE